MGCIAVKRLMSLFSTRLYQKWVPYCSKGLNYHVPNIAQISGKMLETKKYIWLKSNFGDVRGQCIDHHYNSDSNKCIWNKVNWKIRVKSFKKIDQVELLLWKLTNIMTEKTN